MTVPSSPGHLTIALIDTTSIIHLKKRGGDTLLVNLMNSNAEELSLALEVERADNDKTKWALNNGRNGLGVTAASPLLT